MIGFGFEADLLVPATRVEILTPSMPDLDLGRRPGWSSRAVASVRFGEGGEGGMTLTWRVVVAEESGWVIEGVNDAAGSKGLRVSSTKAQSVILASKAVASLSKLYPKDVEAPDGRVDDMTKLPYLHEPGVLQNISTRYTLNEIYTYTGNILIAVNPFQRLAHLYDAQMMTRYKGVLLRELSPHVLPLLTSGR